jgi:cytosolic carboxypeptidase protein 2/3
MRATEKESLGWHRVGTEISCCRNVYHYLKGGNKKMLTLFRFSSSFNTKKIAVTSHTASRTYTDLQQFLSRLESDCRIRKILRRKLLCHSLAGNRCDVLTITNPPARPSVCIGEASAPDMAAEKKCVVLSALVHPGETNAS